MIVVEEFHSKIKSRIEEVGKLINKALDYISHNAECTQDCMFETKVVLSELIQNAIKHGNKGNVNKYVELVIRIKDNYIYITVKDEGKGYNYKKLMEDNRICQLKGICSQKETGRGILIVENLCEKMVFNKEGNQITVVKRT